MIRFILGLMIVMGCVGGLENPDNSMLLLMGTASFGLMLMYSYVAKIRTDSGV